MPVTKSKPEEKDVLAPFRFHGLEFTEKGGQGISDCPFCGKPDHFFCNLKTGQWDCKVCGAKGNTYTFLNKLVTLHKATSADRKKLAKARRLPSTAINGELLGYDKDADRFYLPVFSPEKRDTLVGLRVWDNLSGPVYGTSGLPLHLLNGNALLDGKPNVFICEGDWDYRALHWLLKECVQDDCSVVGVPGAQTFKKEWVPLFKGRKVYLCYDNDNAGETGMAKAAEMLSKVAHVHVINWPSGVESGYDMNDFVSDRQDDLQAAFLELQGMLVPLSSEKAAEKAGHGDPPKKVYDKIPTFKELVKEYKKNVHLDRNMTEALSIVLASALSIKMPGDPIWMFLVGTAGSGKTLLLRSMQDSEVAHYESNLRPHALVSGMRMDDGEDASLIPRLKGRCLVLKDYTEVRSQDRTAQEAIYGILRGAYDGHVRYTFGNGLIRDYPDCHFAMVAGVTHEIHGDNRASLGERFLKCEYLGDDHDSEQHIRAAMDGLNVLSEKEIVLRDKVAAFLSQELSEPTPAAPEWVKTRLVGLAQLVAQLRTAITYGYRGEMLYRPRPEEGTRLAKQLLKLGKALCYVFGKKAIDKEVYRLMEKVALDTGVGFHQDVIFAIMAKYPRPLTVKDLCLTTRLSRATIEKKLLAMVDLQQLNRAAIKRPQAGQPEFGYVVAPHIVKLWQQAKIGSS